MVKVEAQYVIGSYLAGEIVNENYDDYEKGQLLIYSQEGTGACLLVNSSGEITSASGIATLPKSFKDACINAGFEVSDYVKIVPDWQSGDTIPNWDSYTLV